MKRMRKRLPAPDPPPETDLPEAIQAREAAERALRLSQARRGRVDRLLRTWREVKRTNHLAAALEKIVRDGT